MTTATVSSALRHCAAALLELADALDDDSRATVRAQDPAWPDVMSTAMAARYCGYKTTGALRKAHLEGKILPKGRRGGGRTWTWARVDLDKFLGGGPAAARDESVPPRPSRSYARKAPRLSPESEEALRRIERAARPRSTR